MSDKEIPVTGCVRPCRRDPPKPGGVCLTELADQVSVGAPRAVR